MVSIKNYASNLCSVLKNLTLQKRVVLIASLAMLLTLTIFTGASKLVYEAMLPRVELVKAIEVKGEKYADVKYAGSHFVPPNCVFKTAQNFEVVYTIRSEQNAFGKEECYVEEILLYRNEPGQENTAVVASYESSYFGDVIYSTTEPLWDGAQVTPVGNVEFEMDLGEWWLM